MGFNPTDRNESISNADLPSPSSAAGASYVTGSINDLLLCQDGSPLSDETGAGILN